MRPRPRQLLGLWAGLLILLLVEFATSFLSFRGRGLLLLPAGAMVVIVALGFMGLHKGPATAKIFALAGLFWLIILLGLGSVDPLTRTLYLN